MIFSLVSPAFTIAILVAMQALLSAVVTDGMINSKHKPNAELVGQGVANMVLGVFGCIPATGGVALEMRDVFTGETFSRVSDSFHPHIEGHDCKLYLCKLVKKDA